MRERYRHAYTTTRNEGFFAKRVILVEGPTESYSLPIYALALGYDFDRLGVSVIECGGKNPIDRLYRIFNELGIPCYVLFDYDKGNSEPSGEKASRDLLQLLGERLDVPEKAHVSSRFACFAVKWESDLKPDITDYDALVAEARQKLGLSADGGRPLIARYIARRLTANTPPSVPPILSEIIKHAVAIKWERSCLQKQKVENGR